LIVGTGKLAEDIYLFMKKNPEYKVVGFINGNHKKEEFLKMKILGNRLALKKIAGDYRVNDIILTVEITRDKQLNSDLVNCKMKGISIYDIPTFYEYFMGKIPIDHIKERWFLYSEGFRKIRSKVFKRLKRVIDLLSSLVLLIMTVPLGLIVALAVKLNSRGPIFFIQERVGENDRLFKLFKFRTMVTNAEEGDPKWAEENDPRITGVGKILRKTRLDELPQLINVLKGEMSLVGPRPEREFFILKLEKKIPHYALRFVVKPGLTGWAQVNYRYGASEEDAVEKLRYDIYYIKNMSLFLDFRIFLKTIKIALFRQGR